MLCPGPLRKPQLSSPETRGLVFVGPFEKNLVDLGSVMLPGSKCATWQSDVTERDECRLQRHEGSIAHVERPAARTLPSFPARLLQRRERWPPTYRAISYRRLFPATLRLSHFRRISALALAADLPTFVLHPVNVACLSHPRCRNRGRSLPERSRRH